MAARVLLIDDDRVWGRLIGDVLKEAHAGMQLIVATSGRQGLGLLEEQDIDVVVLDFLLPGEDAFQILDALRARSPQVAVILLTAAPSYEIALEAGQRGIDQFVAKDNDNWAWALPVTIRAALGNRERRRLARELRPLMGASRGTHAQMNGVGPEARAHYRQAGILGESPALLSTLALADAASTSDLGVLLIGETGTGKELLAKAIHDRSARIARPFVAVSCANLQESLLQSQLFGHVRGAFTGSTKDHAGIFERAHSGTVFLDEIGACSSAVQHGLLRVLEAGEVTRLGAEVTRRVDVRVIAATDDNLEDSVRDKKFDEALYYRLNGLEIVLPPLRERIGDVPMLANHFKQEFSREQKKLIRDISIPAMQALEVHSWPGNVRELRKVIQRAVACAQVGDQITRDLFLHGYAGHRWEMRVIKRTAWPNCVGIF